MTKNNDTTKSPWTPFLVLLLSSSLAGNIYQYFNKQTIAAENAIYFQDTLQRVNLFNDSLYNSLTEMETLIANVQSERNLAVGKIDEAERQISLWKAKAQSFRNRINSGNLSNEQKSQLLIEINNYKKQIDIFQKSLNEKSMEIASLKSAITNIKTEKIAMEAANNLLNEKINNAAEISFSPMNIFGIQKRKSGNRIVFDASKINDFYIEFSAIGSKLITTKQNHEIKILVKSPDGGLFLKDGTLEPSPSNVETTFSELLNYQGKTAEIKYKFTPQKRMKAGEYRIILFVDETLVQERSIILY